MVWLGSSRHFTHPCLARPLALGLLLTSSNHLLDLDTGHIDLLGELSDGLIGILVGKGVNVNFHPGSNQLLRVPGTICPLSLSSPESLPNYQQ